MLNVPVTHRSQLSLHYCPRNLSALSMGRLTVLCDEYRQLSTTVYILWIGKLWQNLRCKLVRILDGKNVFKSDFIINSYTCIYLDTTSLKNDRIG